LSGRSAIEVAELVFLAKLQPVSDGIDARFAELRKSSPAPQAFASAVLGDAIEEPAELCLDGLAAAVLSGPGLRIVISEVCDRFGRDNLLLAHFARGKFTL
jgi:hypothetical protein